MTIPDFYTPTTQYQTCTDLSQFQTRTHLRHIRPVQTFHNSRLVHTQDTIPDVYRPLTMPELFRPTTILDLCRSTTITHLNISRTIQTYENDRLIQTYDNTRPTTMPNVYIFTAMQNMPAQTRSRQGQTCADLRHHQLHKPPTTTATQTYDNARPVRTQRRQSQTYIRRPTRVPNL